LTFDPFSINLPVTDIIDKVKSHLQQGNTLIVNAPPGAGKSTLLPLALLNEPWLNGKKIIMLEPRRLAAKSIAARMSQLLGTSVGDTIGYRIRFDNKVSKDTRIEVVTEGILTRMLQSDNALEDLGMVIFDEFHERSIFADVALALCREAQNVLRPDLRIVVMSATLNMPQLSSLLQAPVSISEGKQYPVEIKYVGGQDERMLPEMVARTVISAIRQHDGDALVFFPGEGEIRKCAEILKTELRDFAIHPLYGLLPQSEQQAAIMPNKHGKRKIVLATSIAETSLTIEGITIVVDSGYSRVSKFDPKSGLSRLETIQLSKDSADQRAGRAGRLAPGVCYRMWTKATHERLQEHRTPEIMEADLTGLMLELAKWGVHNIYDLTWLSLPPKAAVSMATDILEQLNAVENGRITEHGKQLQQLPCHPRIAHMLLKAREDDAVSLAADIAAVLEERDPLPRDSGIDINLRLEALRRAREAGNLSNRLTRIDTIARSYAKMLGAEITTDKVDLFETGLLLAHAYPERIACARTGNNAQFQLANGKIAVAGHRDDLADEPWLAVAHMDARDGLGKIFLAAPLNPKDLLPLVKEKDVTEWDSRKGGLVAAKQLRIGNIILKSTPLKNPDEALITQALLQAVRTEGKQLLEFTEALEQLQNRILSLRTWNPDQNWPDVQTPSLLANPDWLVPYLKDIKRNEDFERINLHDALLHHLPWEQQQQLAQLAPQRLEVPSGSNITIEYGSTGEAPVLAVRLQEVFGLLDTPRINNGSIPVVMHLLSPGFKPVQVTTDLKSFWQNTYFEVRSELKRRYPKHAWPDDPLKALPVAKGGVRR
jgi:ATP-dependent helicase HrpB